MLERWEQILLVRSELTRALEIARRDKVIGHSLDAEVRLAAPGRWGEFIAANWQTLQEVTMVSEMELDDKAAADAYQGEEIAGLQVSVKLSGRAKCERCWNRAPGVGEHPDHPTICERCAQAVGAA